MLRDEFNPLLAGATAAPSNWNAPLASFADFARAAGRRLEASRPQQQPALLAAIEQLHEAIVSPQDIPEPQSRGLVAALAGYVHAASSTLHEFMIPAYETDANDAAKDCDDAALRILRGMNRDFGCV